MTITVLIGMTVKMAMKMTMAKTMITTMMMAATMMKAAHGYDPVHPVLFVANSLAHALIYFFILLISTTKPSFF